MWRNYPIIGDNYKINPDNLAQLRQKTLLLYIVFLLIVLTDIVISGINPLALLMGTSENELFGNESITKSFYFRNCADCLVTTIILYSYLKGKFWKLGLLIIPAFILFAIMGFRYRMIITMMGLIIVHIAGSSTTFKFRRWTLVGISIMYFIFFITYNRWSFISGQFGDLTYNPASFDYEMFFEQTHQSLNDYNLIRYYEENTEIKHDLGLTMFGYIFIKALPRGFFKNGEKPYPPPALIIVNDSLELPTKWPKTGETTMHYGGFYGAFGWFGVVIMPFLMGFLVHYFSSKNSSEVPAGFLKQIVLSLALFMLISRGYIPQFIDNFVYLSIPIWLMSKSLKKASISYEYKDFS
jgi:oligosaccharide repeat unit polymerase